MYENFIHYKAWLNEQPFSPSTKRSYESAVANFCRYLHRNRDSQPTKETIAAYLQTLKEEYSPTSQSAYVSAIRSYCHFLGIPLPAVTIQRPRETRPRTLSDAEHEKVLKAIVASKNYKTAALIAVFLQCGLKVSEICALSAQDVSMVQSRIVITVVKAGASRVLPMNDAGTKIMVDWLARRLLLRRNQAEKALFLNNNGSRLSTSGVNSLLDAFGKEIGVSFTAQSLRNTCLKHFVMQTQNIKAVAELAGYKSSKSQAHLIRILPPHAMATLH